MKKEQSISDTPCTIGKVVGVESDSRFNFFLFLRYLMMRHRVYRDAEEDLTFPIYYPKIEYTVDNQIYHVTGDKYERTESVQGRPARIYYDMSDPSKAWIDYTRKYSGRMRITGFDEEHIYCRSAFGKKYAIPKELVKMHNGRCTHLIARYGFIFPELPEDRLYF